MLGLVFLAPGAAFRLHHHQEEERYILVEGKGEMTLGNQQSVIEGPQVVHIASNIPHGYLATTHTVTFYMFKSGPFENIVYHRHDTEPNFIN